jgi:uncharacterized UPF0160 family protein
MDFIEGMDANDNGVSQYASGTEKLYKDGTSLARRVSRLNPSWNDPVQDDAHIDKRFGMAVEMVGAELKEIVQECGLSWLPARSIVEKSLKGRFDVDPSGRIAILSEFCPWFASCF